MLNIGDKAPDFSLVSDSGKKASLKDFRGQNLVLYFYPKADTPGCTVEANQFRDASKELTKAKTNVVGVSADPPEALRKFRDKYQLNFPLLSDPDHKMLEAYGVWQEKNMYGKKSMGIVRTTYIIGPEGKITHVFPRVKVDGHTQQVLEAVKKR
ncbi:MAG TPA: thioredoxin-dependent thiol peroxidase [Terriglobia bacterium]|nr:thioredoxin-dependent thiol peroxidase [Terriglobia bacterium]